MLKILQARLQQYMNWELPDVQPGFIKGRGTRDQIANIHWIIEKENSRKTSISASLTTLKILSVWITTNCGKFLKRWEYQTTLLVSWETYTQVKKQQLKLDTEQLFPAMAGNPLVLPPDPKRSHQVLASLMEFVVLFITILLSKCGPDSLKKPELPSQGFSLSTGLGSTWSVNVHMNIFLKHQKKKKKLGKEYVKAVYCHPACLTSMQSTSCEMLDWMSPKLESRLPGKISTTSDMHMLLLLSHFSRVWLQS